VVLLIAAIVAGLWLKRNILDELPTDLADVRSWRPPTACELLDADGLPLDSFYAERRFWVPIEELPEHLLRSIVVAEDRSFAEHAGVDPRGIGRAVRANWEAGHAVQGGSTITQQLVRMVLVEQEQTLERKMKEAVLAWRLEQSLSKEEILELYVNTIALGSGNYGVEAASRDYFGVSARELDPGQSALLAGIIPAPSRWSPRSNPDGAIRRRALVLRSRVELGDFPDERTIAPWLSDPALVAGPVVDDGPVEFAAFVTAARRQVRATFGDSAPFTEGLRIRTTLDRAVQAEAEAAIEEAAAAVEERQRLRAPRRRRAPDAPRVEGAAVVMESATGRVVAVVGGRDVGLEGFVRATQARRQPGSTFKLFVYATELSRGKTQADLVWPMPVIDPEDPDPPTPPPWMPIRDALVYSVNEAATSAYLRQPPGAVPGLAAAMGVRTPLRDDKSVALGSSEVTPLDMATAYATVARGGVPVEPTLLDEVTDVRGARIAGRGEVVTLPDGEPARMPGKAGRRVLPPGVAGELTDMLQGVFARGTARRFAREGFARAGKTGTTDDYVDAWFVGFTPRWTVAVWIGTDGRSSLGPREYGARAALPAWDRIVRFLEDRDPEATGLRFVPSPETVLIELAGRPAWVRRGHIPRTVLTRPSLRGVPVPAYLSEPDFD
jgi:penicillin-binding protein 1A